MRLRLAAMVVLAAFDCMGTTISETNVQAAGQAKATGYFTIQANMPFTAADGVRVDTVQRTVRLVNGGFSLSLEPNDCTGCTGSAYNIWWHLDGAKPRPETWQVPTSSSTLHTSAVIVNAPPAPSLMVQPQQISGPASVGQAITWNGSSAVWGNVSGSGAGQTINQVSWSASPVFDLSLGNIQQITLTADVTSASVLHLTAGWLGMFAVCQDSVGGHAWTWPGAVNSGVTVGTVAGKCSSQWFYSVDGVHLISQGIGVVNQ